MLRPVEQKYSGRVSQRFPLQSQSGAPEVNPHTVRSHEPATLYGAAQPHPVWTSQCCFRGCPTCGPTSREDGCLLPPCQLHRCSMESLGPSWSCLLCPWGSRALSTWPHLNPCLLTASLMAPMVWVPMERAVEQEPGSNRTGRAK